eukprot:768589-Hanusia_phi.AAC.5
MSKSRDLQKGVRPGGIRDVHAIFFDISLAAGLHSSFNASQAVLPAGQVRQAQGVPRASPGDLNVAGV